MWGGAEWLGQEERKVRDKIAGVDNTDQPNTLFTLRKVHCRPPQLSSFGMHILQAKMHVSGIS